MWAKGKKPASGMLETAVEALRTNIMLADKDLNITYLNPAVRNLLQEAEAELRSDLPNFSVDRLVGSNIDVFHKNPAHQRPKIGRAQRLNSSHTDISRMPSSA